MNMRHRMRPENGHLLSRISGYCAGRPYRVLLAGLLLSVLSIAYTIAHLEFKTGRNDLVTVQEPSVKRYEALSEDFGRMTHALVAVEGDDLDRMKRFITELADRLRKEPDWFEDLFYRIDTASLEGKKLLYLSEDELIDLKAKLTDYRELIEELTFLPKMSIILSFVNQKISEATVSHLISGLIGGDPPASSGNGAAASEAAADPDTAEDPVDLRFLRSLLMEMRAALQEPYRFQSPWDTFFDTEAEFKHDGYLISGDDRFAFLILDLKKKEGAFTKRQAALERLRHHLTALRVDYPELNAGVTGEVALSTDEMVQAFRDTAYASVVTLIGIGLLFTLVFRQVFNPLLVLFSLLMAISWTFGWLTLTVGHLTILSVAFTPILMGLGVDFGIHLVARFKEESTGGRPLRIALERSCRYTGKAITAGALTTALAFFAIMLADFRGIRELGFIAGSGVVLAFFSTFTVLPALLALTEKDRPVKPGKPSRFQQTLVLLGVLYRHPRWVLTGALIFSLLAGVRLAAVRFDYNLLNLQAEGTESVVWERKITEHSKRSSWYALTTAASLDEARRKEAVFKALSSVRKVDSLADLLPENQEGRMAHVKALHPLVRQFDLEMEKPEPLAPEEIRELLEKIKFKLRADGQWDPQKRPAEREILLTRQALLALEEDLQSTDSERIRKRLEPFQERLFEDFAKKFQLLKDNSDPPGRVEEADIPVQLRDRFQGGNGDYLLRIYAEKNIWEKEAMAEFVSQLQAVEPEITGSPVIGYTVIHLMRKGYLKGSLYAFAAIGVVTLFVFRRIAETGLTLIPLAFTVLWTLGWMGWTDTPFNLANVIALPLILGIVVDDGIHVVHRFRERPDSAESLISGSTAQAITLTSWTTMIGFGSLLISRHFGIFSLGMIITAAVATAWILSLVVLPVILQTCRRFMQRDGHRPALPSMRERP